jgi:hypothetical protein
MPTFFENLASHKAAIKTAADLTAANTELQSAIDLLTSENSKLGGEVATLTVDLAAAKLAEKTALEAQKDFDAKVEQLASSKAAEINGRPPVASSPGQEAPKLKGRERFIAASNADLGITDLN